VVKRGDGGDNCLCGRRKCWDCYFKVLICRLTKRIGGFEIWRLHIPFQWVALITFWRLSLWFQLCQYRSYVGIRISRWRTCFFAWRLFRDRLQQRTTSFDATSLVWIFGCAYLDVILWRLQLISYYIVPFLALFDIIFIGGWVFPQLYLILYQIILLNLCLLLVVPRLVNQLCRCFGLLQYGKFGKKEITGYSKPKNAPLFRWLTK